jgi:hypothetical protein
MTTQTSDPGLLECLLDTLDLHVQQNHRKTEHASYRDYERRDDRHRFRTRCIVRFSPPGTSSILEFSARTRNLSRNGLSVLVNGVNEIGTFQLGDALEVELKVSQQPALFLAGQVRMCRYAGQGYHEVGLSLNSASRKPTFPR